jgi:hypothetical protein
MRTIVVGSLLVAVSACGPRSTPGATVDAYRNAVQSNRPGQAWALMSDEVRSTTSRARFDTGFEQRVEASADLLDALDDAAHADAVLMAHLPFSAYETLELGWIDGQWRIVGGVGTLFDHATPRSTVISFVRAVRARDAAQLRALAPAEWRAWMSNEDVAVWMAENAGRLDEIAALVEAALDGPVTATDDRASLRYGGAEMVLVREAGRWVIEDFDRGRDAL